ncbi:unnamed protein product [Hymenolepis diminuta]|uniref:Lipoprotein n=1 Tax=Hymenolepis diminuta TaxID=6216 RepID=A0A0R3SHK1_HYMDI|nr:unnamed protein product [Hymenolepis diminuta]VUZ40312.1 unnamed protein product [Hymenolepis diminuta]
MQNQSTERSIFLAVRIIRAIFSLYCITCGSVIFDLGGFDKIAVSRWTTAIVAGIVIFVFGVMMGRRRLIWIIIPMVSDAALIVTNILTVKGNTDMKVSDWLSVSLIIVDGSHFGMGLAELVYVSIKRRRKRARREDPQSSRAT